MRVLRLFLLLVTLGTLAPPARAEEPGLFGEEVGFLSSESRAVEHTASLGLSLRGYGIAVRNFPFADGDSPLGRAAAGQRALREHELRAVLWVEPEAPARLRALAAASDQMFEAPLPSPFAQLEPAVFASVATSVVLETLGRTRVVLHGPILPSPHSAHVPVAAPPESAGHPRVDPTAGLPRRFFLRASGSLAVAYLRSGQDVASSLPSALLQGAAARANGFTGMAKEQTFAEGLARGGYDCDVEEVSEGMLAASDCKSKLSRGGLAFTPAFELALGAQVAPRLALALTGRIARPGWGALVGLQVEGLLTRPRAVGGWLAVTGGVGAGRFQVAVPTSVTLPSAGAPRITGGVGELHAGFVSGYRFHPNVGLTLGLAVRYMLPSPLALIDPTLGLEVRM